MNKKRNIIYTLLTAILFSMILCGAGKLTVSLNAKKITTYIGSTRNLQLKNATGKVQWTSSNNNIARVNASGVVTGVKPGKAAITAKNNGKKYTCTVNVKNHYEHLYDYIRLHGKVNANGNKAVTVEKDDNTCMIIYNSETKEFEFTYIYDTSVLLDGATFYVDRYGKKPVTMNVMFLNNASLSFFSGKISVPAGKYDNNYTLPINVTDASSKGRKRYTNMSGVIVNKAVTDINSVLASKVNIRFSNLGLYKAANSATKPYISSRAVKINVKSYEVLSIVGGKGTVKWSSSKTSVATVSASGRVTAKKRGTAVITAQQNGVKYTCKVTVTDNIAKIYSYVIKNGKKGSGSRKYISRTENGYKFYIYQGQKKNELKFIMRSTGGGGYSARIDMWVARGLSRYKYQYRYSDMISSVNITGKVNFKTYNYINGFSFSKYSLDNVSQVNARFYTRLDYAIAMSGWDNLLVKRLGLSMDDIYPSR